MRKKLRLKKRKQHGGFHLFLYTFGIALLTCFSLIIMAGKKLEPVIVNYAGIETKRIATAMLNDIIRGENFLDSSSLYKITKNEKNEIELITFDTKKVNDILNKINDKASVRLIALENGDTRDITLSNGLKGASFTALKKGVVCEIPLGVLLGNSLLVNNSATVPIRFSFIGSVKSNLESKVTAYGVNSALVELFIKVSITEQITMPHTAKEITVTLDVPLVVEIVKGQVPLYYQDSLAKESKEAISILKNS